MLGAYLKSPWTNLIVGAMISVILGFYFSDNDNRSIKIQQTSQTKIINDLPGQNNNIQVFIGGQAIERPYVTAIQITNNGKKPIRPSDFDGNLEISFGASARIEKLSVRSTKGNAKPEYLKTDNSVHIKPLLLNSGDEFLIEILSSKGTPQPSTKARIAGINEIKIITAQNQERLHPLFPLAMAFLFMLGAFLAYPQPGIESISNKSRIFILGLLAISGSTHIVSVSEAMGLTKYSPWITMALGLGIMLAALTVVAFLTRHPMKANELPLKIHSKSNK